MQLKCKGENRQKQSKFQGNPGMIPKYSILEVERRWLVDESLLPDLGSLKKQIITDIYISSSRMRLRKMERPDDVQYKLCKKYGRSSPFAEPITNIYLTKEEYDLFARLPGKKLIRERAAFVDQGKRYSINTIIFGNGPTTAEAEFPNEEKAEQCQPPAFCVEDVTQNSAFEAVRFAKAA